MVGGCCSVSSAGSFSRGERGVYLAIGVAVVVVGMLAAVLGARTRPAAPRVLGRCPVIDIFAGQGGAAHDSTTTPYDEYADVISRNITQRFPGSVVNVVATQGSAFNVGVLADPKAATCWLSISGLSTAVDAHEAVYQFEGRPVTTVRTIGPLWLDFIQVVVRAPNPGSPDDRPVTALGDLCQQNRTLETGLVESGTERTGTILLRQLRAQIPDCNPTMAHSTLADAVDAVRSRRADALLWSGGAPTPTIADALKDPEGATLTLLPLGTDYLVRMQSEWDAKYPFLHGGDYRKWTLRRDDYTRIDATDTIASSNVVLANAKADGDLVTFVAGLLVDDRSEFEAALWKNDPHNRHFLDLKTEIQDNKLYCAVQLHPSAAAYYWDHLHAMPTCPRPGRDGGGQ